MEKLLPWSLHAFTLVPWPRISLSLGRKRKLNATRSNSTIETKACYGYWQVYQSGSSIQKKSKEVIGSSTQPTSSNQTAKQTKLDYAITIQTLLALQDQGLTTLTKKTWADIVSDEEQEGENLDLAFLIKNLKNHKTICNPRMSQELQT